ncbi:MAG: CmcI family methyltransferase [Chloroflexota bacterium]
MNTNFRVRLDQLNNYVHAKLYGNRLVSTWITNQFHKLYYSNHRRTWRHNTHWFGIPLLKMPTDLWVYQELVYELQPDAIIECGTFDGGSALYFAHLCDLLGKGRVLSIDIDPHENLPDHPRITYLTASSTAPETIEQVQSFTANSQQTLIILDSDHTMAHVLDELRLYQQFVKPGGYIIVEDGNVNGRPVMPFFGPGPYEAVQRFLKETEQFMVDKDREKFYLTSNPSGYLRRVNKQSA